MDEFSMLSQPVSLWRHMLKFFCTSNIQGKELSWHDSMKYAFIIVLCWDTREPICFKLRMMLNMTKLYSLSPVWMTLMFTQDHRVTGKLELVPSFCCEIAWSNCPMATPSRGRGISQLSVHTPFSPIFVCPSAYWNLSCILLSPINCSRHSCSFLARTVLSVFTGLSPIFCFFTSPLFANSLFLWGLLETWHTDSVPWSMLFKSRWGHT